MKMTKIASLVIIIAFMLAFFIVEYGVEYGYETGWKRIESPNSPWNSPENRAAMFKKIKYYILYTISEERWEDRDGKMTPYWSTFKDAIDCLRNSAILKPIIEKAEADPVNTTSPYAFYLVSIDPEIIIVSVQQERSFDYWNMFVIPSTTIPRSKKLYWFSPNFQSEPKIIELDLDGNGKFNIEQDVIEIHKNSNEEYNILRTAQNN